MPTTAFADDRATLTFHRDVGDDRRGGGDDDEDDDDDGTMSSRAILDPKMLSSGVRGSPYRNVNSTLTVCCHIQCTSHDFYPSWECLIYAGTNEVRDAESPRSRGYSEFERGDELRFRMRRMGGGLLLAVPGKVDLRQIIQLLLPVPRGIAIRLAGRGPHALPKKSSLMLINVPKS